MFANDWMRKQAPTAKTMLLKKQVEKRITEVMGCKNIFLWIGKQVPAFLGKKKKVSETSVTFLWIMEN